VVTQQSRALSAARPMERFAYRPALDGIRALAVAAVLAFHGGVAVLSGGFLGVDVFFVLSGYLITSLLLTEHAGRGRIGLLAFWGRRVRRLVPALLLVVLVVALMSRWLLPPEELPGLRWDALAALGYGANWRMAERSGDYFADTGALSAATHVVAGYRGAVLPVLAAACGDRVDSGRWPIPAGRSSAPYPSPGDLRRRGGGFGGHSRAAVPARCGGSGLLRHGHPGGRPAYRLRAGCPARRPAAGAAR
jgi:hypothetical protein